MGITKIILIESKIKFLEYDLYLFWIENLT